MFKPKKRLADVLCSSLNLANNMIFPLFFDHFMAHWDCPQSVLLRIAVVWMLVLSAITSRTDAADHWVAVSAFNQSVGDVHVIGGVKKLLVAVGSPASLVCESLRTALDDGHKTEQILWIKRQTTRSLVVYPLGSGQWRYTVLEDRTNLFVDNVQVTESAYFDCHTLLKGGEEWASRVHVVVQDCGDGDGYDGYNPRNPCQYGGNCQLVEFAPGIDLFRLKCACMAQFTGKFCNVPISSNIDVYELMFYAPLIFHTLVLAVGGIAFTRVLSGRSEKRVSNRPNAPVVSQSKHDLKQVEIK
uniref:EGF-like domain-containing protein n=1 Tax=Plectus sambesii TaxID=2011161 RepID=A0A914W8D1_9BILA